MFGGLPFQMYRKIQIYPCPRLIVYAQRTAYPIFPKHLKRQPAKHTLYLNNPKNPKRRQPCRRSKSPARNHLTMVASVSDFSDYSDIACVLRAAFSDVPENSDTPCVRHALRLLGSWLPMGAHGTEHPHPVKVAQHRGW